MSAQPVEETPPYDPAMILDALPPAKRPHFLALYEEAVEAAHSPGEYRRLYELLHLWSLKAKIYVTDPHFDRTPEELLADLDHNGGTPLQDAIPDWQERLRRQARR